MALWMGKTWSATYESKNEWIFSWLGMKKAATGRKRKSQLYYDEADNSSLPEWYLLVFVWMNSFGSAEAVLEFDEFGFRGMVYLVVFFQQIILVCMGSSPGGEGESWVTHISGLGANKPPKSAGDAPVGHKPNPASGCSVGPVALPPDFLGHSRCLVVLDHMKSWFAVSGVRETRQSLIQQWVRRWDVLAEGISALSLKERLEPGTLAL